MAEVIYNGFTFPYPQPFVGVSDSPISQDGKVDSSALSIEVVGTVTGSDLSSLEASKRALITGLSTSFKTLQVGTDSYAFAQPTALNFADSDLTSILPYSASFIAYETFPQNGLTTLYTGLYDLQDSWDFKEQEKRMVEVTHTVKAKGRKISGTSPLDLAKSFVTGRANHFLGDVSNPSFVNFSVFLSGTAPALTSRSEEIDQFAGAYGITDTYMFSTAEEDPFQSGVLSVDTKTSWTRENGIDISLDGSLQGGLTGLGYPQMTTGMFSVDEAKYYATQATERSKSDFESGVYGSIFNAPKTYNYNVDEEANTIDFSFKFVNPNDPRNQTIKHEYSAAINATKDTNVVTVAVNGSLIYNDPSLVMNTGAPETGARFIAVEEAFAEVDIRGIALQNFATFVENVDAYTSASGINENPVSAQIDKFPFESKISYNYSFDNNLDLSTGTLKNSSLTVSNTYSVQNISAVEAVGGGFALHTGFYTMPVSQVDASAELPSGVSAIEGLVLLSGLVDTFVYQYALASGSGVVSADNFSTGSSNLSINKTFLFPQP